MFKVEASNTYRACCTATEVAPSTAAVVDWAAAKDEVNRRSDAVSPAMEMTMRLTTIKKTSAKMSDAPVSPRATASSEPRPTDFKA